MKNRIAIPLCICFQETVGLSVAVPAVVKNDDSTVAMTNNIKSSLVTLKFSHNKTTQLTARSEGVPINTVMPLVAGNFMQSPNNRRATDFKYLKICMSIVISLMLWVGAARGQTTKTVGATGADFSTLKSAFDAINAGTINGAITLQIISSTTETLTADLSASGTGSADYSSITIYPIAPGYSIGGNIAAPVINLNDADNVTIDGRVNQSGSVKSLTISNTNTGGAVIQFINDATSNVIRYCIVRGTTISATSGVIVFSTGTGSGNDNNTIEFCDIRDGATTPTNAIYSAGTSVSADNSGISISNCNIFNYFSASLASNGIFVDINNSAWTITSNRFYQTASRMATVGSTHRAIQILSTSGVNYTVSNNIIGFANESGTGTTNYAGAFANLFRAIELTAGTSTASSLQGNTISGINFSTTSGLVTAPGIFTGISVLAGSVNIGTTSGNTIGATTGTGSISIASTTSLGYIAGIYATSTGTVSVQNNNIGSFSTAGGAAIGYTFNAINTAGTGGNITISSNTIGSTSTAHSVAIGNDAITTIGVCSFSGIRNVATGTISLTSNTVQNCSVYGTAASVFSGIANTGGLTTLDISGNNVIAGTITGTGAFIGITNSAAAISLNISNNIIRNHIKTSGTGIFTAISNTGAILTAININNNQLGNISGDLITYAVANTAALVGISNSAGAASCELFIQNNDIRGIVHTVPGANAHTYIINSAATLSQNISSNTFTNLNVNTTGSVTFITVSNGLYAGGVQTVNSNSIVTAFNKSGAGGTLTFCNASGTSQPGSVITQNLNNFSNVTVTGSTVISGWINSNTSLNKTINTNTFIGWTGGSATLTVMTITGGSSTVSANVISNMTTGTAAAAPIIAISSGATGVILITNNYISGLVTGSAAFINSFTGITNNAGTDVTITGNTIIGCTAGGTGISIFTGITTITAGSGTLTITGNSIISGTNAGTGLATFTAISNGTTFATVNVNSNVIRNNSITSATGAFTAISNAGVVTTAININYNQLGNTDGGLITYAVANSGALLGIRNSAGAASCALSIQNNDFSGISYSIAGTNAHTYIINSATTLTQNISNNTFTNLSVYTTGAILFISNNVAMPANGMQNVNGNSIVTSFTRTAASGAITLFTSTTPTNNNNITVNNNGNNFSNITISGTATISGWINQDAGLGTYTKTIDGNTFNNWNAGVGTGAITALSVNIASTNNAVKNNVISNISSAGIITGITTGAGNDNIFSNEINNLNSTGGIAATIVAGINVTAGTTKNIYSNTISNLIGNTLTTGSVNGIYVTAGTAVNVYQNTIFTVTANANTTGSISAIWVTGGTNVIIDRNKCYDISSTSTVITTGSVQGIQLSGTTANLNLTISNNLIGDIRTPAMSLVNAVRGISILSTGTTSNNHVYYNTIYLNASSTGTNFGTSGIFHAVSSTATTASLDMRNNLIVNLSTPNGTGLTVAYRRSAGAAGNLANYASTSNNNLFYAGAPSATRLIYADGTSSAQTLAAYKTGVFTAGTIAPRDQASVTENPSFLSLVGANANFLHINGATTTQIESGAVNIPSSTVDYDGNIRQGNPGYTGTSITAPDIGADEGDFTLIDNSAPSITYSLVTNNSCSNNQSLSAIITDATGVNTTLGTRSRVYFKRSTDINTYNSNISATAGWKWVETTNTSSPFGFTFDYSLLSGGTGVAPGTIVQYFVVAQDVMPTPNVGLNAGIFNLAPPSVALTASAFPIGGTINSYTILAGLSGSVTIGASGTYTTLTGAGGLFSAINTYGLNDNLIATIMDASITETGANALNAIIYGCANNYTLTIKPNTGLATTLTGSVAGPLITLNGADNVIIDGLNTGGSSLTIQNTSAAGTPSTIRFIGDASTNIITNCNIEGSGTGAASGTLLFSTGISTGNDGNTISNNTIRPAGINLPTNAIYSAGTSVAIDNSENVINNNNIQDYFNAGAPSNGIYIASNSSAWTISGNKFFQTATLSATTGSTHHAIQILTTLGVNYAVSNNIIGYANSSSTGTTTYSGAVANFYRAIELTVGTATASNVDGNNIAGISLSTTSGLITAPGLFSGISVLAGTVNIGTNSGNTIGATTGTGSISIASTTSLGYIAGIYAISSSAVNIRNNNIGAISASGTALIGYTFHGINTAGGGQVTISANTIGSVSTANSIAIGDGTTSTPVCTFNGINNTATGTLSITGNTIRNVSVYGTGVSVFNGIVNSGVSNLVDMNSNNIISVTNTGSGALIAISNSAAATTVNINSNIIRDITKSVTTGVVTAISNTGGVLTAININNNQLGNSDGGLIIYTVANSGALTGISNTAGAASSALSIQSNDIRGIVHSVAGSGAHIYITNSAATLTQNISSNTFTNLNVNTTGSVTFITVSNGLFASGVQIVNSNSIVTAFNKSGAGGTVTFCNATGTSQPGSVITQNLNNFSNVTVMGSTIISGWINSNTCLDKTINTNTFSNWTGGSAAVTVMTITGGASTISSNAISTITTGTAAVAPIVAISSGATAAIAITNNTISGLVTGTAAYANSFTGITNNAGTDVTITGNIITGCRAGGTGISLFTGITAITAGSGTLTITGNSIISGIYAGTGTGATFTAISNATTFATVNINNNIIRSNIITSAAGMFTAISNSGAVTTVININNNQLGNTDGSLISYTVANSAALMGISNSAGAASSALSIQGNDIRGITNSVAGSSPHTYITNTAATLLQNISGNTFTNLSVNTTGAIIFISDNVAMPANGIQNVNNNSIVTSFTRLAGSGAITLFTSTTATNNNNVIVNNNNNNFSNITISGTASILGWINQDAGLGTYTKTMDGNTFSNWSSGVGTGIITALTVNITNGNNAIKNNTISNISSAGTITGITSGAGNNNFFSNTIDSLVSTGGIATVVTGIAITGGTTSNVYQNTIYNLQANNITTGNVSGISISSGFSNFVYRNKIYNISSSSIVISTGSINGILISGAIADQITTLHNNRIGDLRANAANVTNPIRGISIVNTGLRSATNVYYNTVYLNASSTGTNFGSTGIQHTASATLTTAALNLRNNIIINLSVPKGTGLTVAYRRSSGTFNMLKNYVGTSNNNLLYAGTPGATRFIYTDGTSSAQTLADYKSGMYTAGTVSPRDQASISENPVFLSTIGSSADFLKINTSAVTFIESGAVNIAPITTDFDGDIRAGNPGFPVPLNGFGNAPDIGADEFDGRKPSVVVSNANAASNGNYDNLGYAFTAINANIQTGNNVLVIIIGSTTETSTATLNAGAWTTLKIYPAVAGLTISGNIDSAPLINLDGADNVTIDGRVNQSGSTKSLTIINNSTSATAGTSTIRFINSAENNTVKYCIIKGSETNTASGVIFFSTATAGNGNDGNTIDNNDITSSATGRPVSAIYSNGLSGYENSGITVSNNQIYNFLNPGTASYGICFSSFTTACTITGNSLFETTSFVPAASVTYNAIYINNTSGNGFAVSGNYVGGSLALCGGVPWMKTNAFDNNFRGITLNVGTTVASSIQNNTVQNFAFSNSGSAHWLGIYIYEGNVNIGTVKSNSVGAATGTGSITVTSGTTGASVHGIHISNAAGTVDCRNNIIGSITTASGDVTNATNFRGIYVDTTPGTITIINNSIGSATTANSIRASSLSTANPQDVFGIYFDGTGVVAINDNSIANLVNSTNNTNDGTTGRINGIKSLNGANTIANNTIHDLSIANSNTSLSGSASVCGIALTGATLKTVSGNTIYNLSNTYASFAGNVIGLYFTGSTDANVVSENFIHSLSVHASSTAATIYGINIASGATTWSNNIISIGGNTATTIYGIYETGTVSNDNNLYFNTISIGGNLSVGISNKSYAFFSAAATNNRDIRNNIFANFRSTTGGTGMHYAAWFNYAVNTGLTLDYNNYFANGSGGVLGYYNGSDKTTLPIVLTQDVNSTIVNPQFINPVGLDPTDYKVAAPLNGVTGTGILLDYGSIARGNPPNMGAWEFFTNRWKGTISTDFATAENWTSNSVPVNNAPIVFDSDPIRDCYLDGNRSVGNITNHQSTDKFIVNGHQLTIKGNLYFENGATIDAGATSSTVIFAGTAAQAIPDGAFTDNHLYNFTVNNSYGVTLQGDLTVSNVLNLQSANPSATIGCLETGTKTLTMRDSAITIGQGDVTGIVKRTSILPNKAYSFGNQFSIMNFLNIGTLPSEISLKISIGTAPAWKPDAIKRIYDLIQTGGSNTQAYVYCHYLDSELNGNGENGLVDWIYMSAYPLVMEYGRSDFNTSDEWVSMADVDMSFFASSFGSVEVTLAESQISALTWNGSVGTSWTTAENWTPNGAPSDSTVIIIPDAATTSFDPIIPTIATCGTMTLESGAIVNSNIGAQLTINGAAGAWNNQGGIFNPGTSNITFTNPLATLSGSTSFNNVTIDIGATLMMDSLSIMRIAGTMTNNGTWYTVLGGPTTVEYNGANQTVVVPSPATNRYSTLILSGSGTKTMPATILSVFGDLSVTGTASVTALNDIVIVGSLNIDPLATFVTGSFNHAIGGDFTHNGTFTATGSNITFDGFTAQSINGTAPATTFENLTINSAMGVTGNKNIGVNGILDFQTDNPTAFKGSLDMGTNTLLMGASATITGTADVSGIVRRNVINAGTVYSFGNSLTTVKFDNTGTLPSELSVKISLGNSPLWKPTAINRIYDFIQTGGSGCYADVFTYYLNSELNGNIQDELVYWGASGFPTPATTELGMSESDTLNNWVLLKNVPIELWPSSFDNMQLTLAQSGHPSIVWNGTISTSWLDVRNWTPVGVPDKFKNIVIPDAATTLNDPLLPSHSNLCKLTIENGGILNASSGAQLNIFNLEGNEGWINQGGTFNPANSSVVFINPGSIISGTTNFYNLNILSGASLTPQAGNTMRIAGSLNNEGILDATFHSNTIEYNGDDQTVNIPNSSIPGYQNLVLSGSGNKTMPSTALNIFGDFSTSGTATATAGAATIIGGNLTIDAGSTFITGNYNHVIGANLKNNGTFTASAGNTIIMNGTSTQSIFGTATTNFEDLNINNSLGVTLLVNANVNNTLQLLSGNLSVGSTTLGINGTISKSSGNIDVSSSSSLSFGGSSAIIIPDNLFTTTTSINNIIINRSGGVTLGNQDMTINGLLDLPSGTISLGAHTLTIAGSSPTRISGTIDAGNASATLAFTNATAITLPVSIFAGDVNNLTINGTGGITVSSDFNLNGVLNLQSANPSATKGSLDMWDGFEMKTISMGASATTIGTGDVTGIVKRTSFIANIAYTFGNQFSTAIISSGGTMPDQMMAKISIGASPSWKTTAINRIFEYLHTGGSNCVVTLSSHYLDAELNGNDENGLVIWGFGNPWLIPGLNEFGRSNFSTTDNWVAMANVNIGYLPTNFGEFENTLAYSELPSYTWNGSQSTSWINPDNWTPVGTPSSVSNIIIPDASTTPNDPTLPAAVEIKTLTIQTGAVLNSASNTQLTINGDNGAWSDGGTFNCGTGKVIFTNASATISGITNFYNVTINSGASLTMASGNTMKIAGAITNYGIWHTVIGNLTTVEYNGGDQTIVVPNPATNRYNNLILSGSGTKTMPGTALDINGNISILGTATTTVVAALTVAGDFSIANGSKLSVYPAVQLFVSGSLTNNAGASGFVLRSDVTGTASLIHYTDNVPATVQRYISGAAEAWHFLSSPMTAQGISGTWLPSGTYGNNTGYDLYVWNEPTNCWIYKLNTTSAINWNTVHPGSNFTPGRGYLYSVQATNPTKEFVGNLNNGSLVIPLTVSSTDPILQGFNLVGNPYPSSMDWQATSGWTRSILVGSGGGYDMWIWNAAANNYGVFNSFTGTGTNSVTRYIAPMQGYFVRAAGPGNLGMDNDVRLHDGIGNWFKNAENNPTRVSVVVQSDADKSFDEALLLFGYSANDPGAVKLFSHVQTAPSLYLSSGSEKYSVQYLTDTIDNPTVPVLFKAGNDGNHTLRCNFDNDNFNIVTLEDRQMHYSQDMKSVKTYSFLAAKTDDVNRFVLHFGTENNSAGNELPARIYSDGIQLIIDLTLVRKETTVMVYDVVGRKMLQQELQGETQHNLSLKASKQILIVYLENPDGSFSRKLVWAGN